jgi:hypothetical protein
MTKHPFYNAIAAIVYVVFVVSIIQLLGHFFGNKPDNTFLAPLFALSLLTLSVAVMAFLFFYTPLTLLLKGNERAAAYYLLKTISFFSLFVAVALVLVLTLS